VAGSTPTWGVVGGSVLASIRIGTMHSNAERKRYERMVKKAMEKALADPMLRIQLAGLRGQEREDRAAAIIRARLKADPKVRPLLDAIGKQMVEAELDRSFEEAIEELVAAGKVRRELDPETGETVYVSTAAAAR
jgi:hypothetical protein